MVLAKEVGDLAKQSKASTQNVSQFLNDAAKSIGEMVRIIKVAKEKTNEVVHSADASGQIVGNLAETLRKNTHAARTIELAIEQQRKGLGLILAEVQRVYLAASENSKVSESVDRESKALNSVVMELTTLIDDWRTPDIKR